MCYRGQPQHPTPLPSGAPTAQTTAPQPHPTHHGGHLKQQQLYCNDTDKPRNTQRSAGAMGKHREGRWEALARSGYRRTLAAGCCPPRELLPQPPEPAAALAEGAGSGQPRAGGSGSGRSSQEAGSVFRWGLKHQPLAPGQAVKVFLPWGSGSAELGGKQGRWSGLSQGCGTGASWPLSGCTNMRLLQHPQQFSSVMLKSPTPQKSQVEEPGPHTELYYTTRNLPLFPSELTKHIQHELGCQVRPGGRPARCICPMGSHRGLRAAFGELQRSHLNTLRLFSG